MQLPSFLILLSKMHKLGITETLFFISTKHNLFGHKKGKTEKLNKPQHSSTSNIA